MGEPMFINYKDAAEHQLREWVEGRPWHNPFSPDGSYGYERGDGECCPDFSCCAPRMIWAKERRYAFLEASDAARSEMLFGALSGLVADHGGIVVGGHND